MIEDSIALTHRRLIAIVRGVVPLRSPDLPFVSLEDDDGRVTPIESEAAGQRHFVWRSLSVPVRPSDRVSCVVTWRRLLRVRYDHTGDGEALELLMAQDAIRIVDALRFVHDDPCAVRAATALDARDVIDRRDKRAVSRLDVP